MGDSDVRLQRFAAWSGAAPPRSIVRPAFWASVLFEKNAPRYRRLLWGVAEKKLLGVFSFSENSSQTAVNPFPLGD